MVLKVFILIAVCACVHAGVLSAKAFYCKDPDTGKLYGVNSTWPSTTFCGNYTCKMRKKNITEAQYKPIKKINITASYFDNPNDIDTSLSASENVPIIMKPSSAERLETNKINEELQSSVLNDFIYNPQIPKNIVHENSAKGKENDRYLTEQEIKTISNLLRNVKKSDLEAIVEIYHLAQDIYSEIDKTTNDNLVHETLHEITNQIENENIKSANNNNFHPALDTVFKVPKLDMQVDGSNAIPDISHHKTTYSSPSYFTGYLTANDFRKVPYYYRLSDFQRRYSYINPNYYAPSQQPLTSTLQQSPPYAYAVPQGSYYYSTNAPIPYTYPEITKQSSLLPYHTYPYTYEVGHNLSNSSSLFSNNNHWNQFDLYREKYPPTHHTGQYMIEVPYEVNEKVESSAENMSEEKSILQKLISKTKEKKPEWQTEPLAQKVIDEVRARIVEKTGISKLLPLRRKLKLEKVGKVTKIDDILRLRRDVSDFNVELLADSIDNIDHRSSEKVTKENFDTSEKEFETYIEKLVSCDTEHLTEPGFYRVGNISEPYPACCPQRISNSTEMPLNVIEYKN